MDIEVLQDGKSAFRLRSKQIYVQDIVVGSIAQQASYSVVDNRSGQLLTGVEDRSRVISAPFFMYDKSALHFPLLRDELFQLFGKEDFFIRELWSDQKEGTQKVSGKQYRVRLREVIQLTRNYKFGQAELVFETTDSPYGQSVMTAQEIQTNGINIDKNWAFGMGLETVEDKELIYTHTAIAGTSFGVFNAGNVEVHPFEAYLKLIIKNVRGSTENFQLTNFTNGSRMRINVPVKSTEVWTYDGPNIKRNSLAAANDTRKDFISLAPGWNYFQIYFCDSAEVSFDFGFLYR